MNHKEAFEIGKNHIREGVSPVVVSDGSIYLNANIDVIISHCNKHNLDYFEITKPEVAKKKNDTKKIKQTDGSK